MDKLIGKVLNGRYIIKEIIGMGGMSVVYKAEDTLEDRFVAIKILKDEFVNEPKFRRRFLNESRAIAMLSHENIVDVVDVNFEGDIQYIVMEYIEGITLKEYINSKGPLSVEEALSYTKQILSALCHAHERGVVHRDIKPQNIMLLPDNRIKVTDFGIAHVSNFETVTMSEMAIGSVHYISPEQAKGLPTDEKSDIYSTGVILYEMITGRLPFESDTAVSVALMQVQQEPPKPSVYIPDLPIGIEQIIMKAMQKKVSYRYRNAKEMLDDIEAFEEDNSIIFDHTADISLDDSTKMIEHIKIDETPEERKKQMWKNRIFALCSGAAAAIILLTIGTILLFTLGSEDSNLIEVPNLIDKSYEAVKEDISIIKYFTITEKQEFHDTVNQGYIISQNPLPGKKYEPGKEITVVVSMGKEMSIVPYIVDTAPGQARVLLENAGLSLGKTTYQTSADIKEGFIISCTPECGSSVATGTVVDIVVSRSPETQTVQVPPLEGQTEYAAKTALTELGLLSDIRLTYDNSVAEGIVISSSPSEGTEVKKGETVTLYISKGASPVVLTIPQDIIGKTEDEVISILTGMGLKVNPVEHEYQGCEPGTVYSVSPAPGTEIEPGITVTISVASGNDSEPEPEQPEIQE